MGIVKNSFLGQESNEVMKHLKRKNNFDIADICSLADRLLQGDFAQHIYPVRELGEDYFAVFDYGGLDIARRGLGRS